MIPNGDLLAAVEKELMPLVAGLPLQIVDHQEGASFDLASVTLEGGNVRVQLRRERGPIHTDFSPATSRFKAFDSFVLMEYLGLSTSQGLTGTEISVVLRAVAAFLLRCWNELDSAFAPRTAGRTVEELQTIQLAQAKARWG